MLARLAILAAVLALPRTVDAGACAQPMERAMILTPAKSVVDKAGGMLVGLSYRDGVDGVTDLAKLPWKLGGAAPVITKLAPDLILLQPRRAAPKVVLVDAKRKSLLEIATTATKFDPAKLPAPQLVTGTFATYSQPRSSGSSTRVTLGANAPDAALAFIVYDAKTKQAKSWEQIQRYQPGAITELVVFYQGRCHVQLPNAVPSRAGDAIYIAWVDATGHVSAPSNSITIK